MEAAQPTLDAVRERTGGRSARVREAVIEAARAQLVEGGYGSLSHAAVAKAAAVDRATVYRRWPTRARLTMDALVGIADATVQYPETGRLESDLREFASAVVALLSDPGLIRMAQALVAAEGDDPELRDVAAEFWLARLTWGAGMVEAAVGRGEIEPVEDPKVVPEALIAPFYFRALISGREIDDALVDSAVTGAMGHVKLTAAG